MTWLEGHSLAQTVFTNLYLQKPHMVEDKIIRAFSIHSLKLLEVIRDFINKAGVFEEVMKLFGSSNSKSNEFYQCNKMQLVQKKCF